MNQELQQIRANPGRIVLIALAIVGLMLSFLLQQVDLLHYTQINAHPYVHFGIRKAVRVVINDMCMLLLIRLWFNNNAITKLAWNVLLIDTLVLLPIYLALKLVLEGDNEISSPLLSQLHRVIVNPTLMILIIPGVYFHRLKSS